MTAIEGSVEEIKYMCPASVSSAQVAGNAEGALKNSGYRIVFKDVYATLRHWITAQSGPQWVAVASTHGTYTVTTVRTKELEQVMQASADSWAQQIAQTGRVSIYGINFDTGRATIRPDSEKVLVEMAGLFQKNPEWYMLVGGHTDNTGGDDINVPLSHQRAEAVIQWLAGHGVEKARLVPAGFGAKKPLADNGSEDGRAKNRRVDLVKLY